MRFRGSMRLCVLHQSSAVTVSEAGSRMRRARRRSRGRELARPHVLDDYPPLVLRRPGQRAVAERVAEEQHATAAAHKLQVRDKSRSCPSQRRQVWGLVRMDSHVAGFARELLDGTHLKVARWRDWEREPSLVAPSDHAAVPAQQLSCGFGNGNTGRKGLQLLLWTLTSRRPFRPRPAAPTAR